MVIKKSYIYFSIPMVKKYLSKLDPKVKSTFSSHDFNDKFLIKLKILSKLNIAQVYSRQYPLQ